MPCIFTIVAPSTTRSSIAIRVGRGLKERRMSGRASFGFPASQVFSTGHPSSWLIANRSMARHVPVAHTDRLQLHTATGAWPQRRGRGGFLPTRTESIGKRFVSSWPRSSGSLATSSRARDMGHGLRHQSACGQQSPAGPNLGHANNSTDFDKAYAAHDKKQRRGARNVVPSRHAATTTVCRTTAATRRVVRCNDQASCRSATQLHFAAHSAKNAILLPFSRC